jgi:hypothetical protein
VHRGKHIDNPFGRAAVEVVDIQDDALNRRWFALGVGGPLGPGGPQVAVELFEVQVHLAHDAAVACVVCGLDACVEKSR